MSSQYDIVVHLRPRGGRKTFKDILGEVFGWEVAVLQQGTSLDLNVSDGTQFFHKCTKRMKRADRL